MLRKLLKYDLIYVFKIWWIMALSILGISLVCGFSFRSIVLNNGDPSYMPWWETLVIFLTVLSISAFITITYILLYVRFYKNLFSDEGYLTFTLPVKRSTILLSKLFNSLIWIAATALTIMLAISLILFLIPNDSVNAEFLLTGVRGPQNLLSTLISALSEIFAEAYGIMGFWLVIYVILIAIANGLLTAGGQLFIYLCITIAAIVAKKHKVLAAIGLIYGANFILSFIYQISVYGWIFIIDAANVAFASIPEIGPSEGYIIIFAAMLLVCVFSALYALSMGFLTLSNIERKLNLA